MSAKKKPETEDLQPDFENMPPDLAETARRLWQTMQKQEVECSQEQPMPPTLKTAEIIQLPLWPEATTGTPDFFLRSALFAASDKGQGYYPKKTPVNTVAGYEIRYQGNQLTQAHLVVWEMLIQLARKHTLGDECIFTGHAFLRMLGYKGRIGESAYKWLDAMITDLAACVVEVEIAKKLAYGAGLIDWYVRDDYTKRFKIKLNRGLIALYGRGQWTQLQWMQRLALKKHPLALWLQGFYSTHAAPFPVSVEFIREKSGSGIKELKHFRQALRKALDKIKAKGVIVDWQIDKKADLVHVTKTPTQAQAMHLAKLPK